MTEPYLLWINAVLYSALVYGRRFGHRPANETSLSKPDHKTRFLLIQ